MQLILCNIFHVDFPTGNIPLAEAERIARAESMVDPLLVELMAIPPNQVANRRPLPACSSA